MTLVEVTGYLAAALTTVSFVPQVLHTWRKRNTEGVSLGMLCLFTSGVACWLLYGIAIDAWPVIAANAITLALSFSLLAMKLFMR